MNVSLISLELLVVLLGIVVLLLDLWMPAEKKKVLGYIAVAGVVAIFIYSYKYDVSAVDYAFGNMYVFDGVALFLKKLFLVAAAIVLLMSIQFLDRIESGKSEYFSIVLFALAGMMFAASSNHFAMMFVSIELITLSFYILVSYQRRRLASLEAGIKYLILGALASGFLVYGIALAYGAAGTMDFTELAQKGNELSGKPIFFVGVLLILTGLGFKIAMFPFQIWAPDVYQGAPVPTTAFLAIGSKAAGVVLMLRFFYSALPDIDWPWEKVIMVLAACTILYGNLCAIPQRNLKRLLAYSSIANAGYILLGIAAMNNTGAQAILYYLAAYLFAVLGAFFVISVVSGQAGSEDLSILAGLNRRSPLMALTLSMSMISLAGIPPLAGFFGKFLLFKAIIEKGAAFPSYFVLAGIAIIGIVISIWYYFGVVRVVYWSAASEDEPAIQLSPAVWGSLCFCIIGMLYLGILPGSPMEAASKAVQAWF